MEVYTEEHAVGGEMLRKLCISGCVAVCCFLLIYAIWVFVAMNRTATIAVDYVALLNEKATAVPEEMRAWPLYRDAAIALQKNPEPTNVFYEDDIEAPTWPTQEGWVQYKKWLLEHTNTINSILEASSRKGNGYILNSTIADEDKDLWPENYEMQQGQPPPDGFLASMLLPQLGPMRSIARLLAMDSKEAAAMGASDRCLAELVALLAVAEHVREQPLLINDLVSLSLYNLTFSTLEEILEYTPSLFSQEELDVLSRELKNVDENLTIRFEGERMFVLDMLQRIYTDDGNGDGKIIPLKVMDLRTQLELGPEGKTSSSLLPAIIAPIADIYLPSRKEVLAEYDRRLSYFETLQLSSQSSQFKSPTQTSFVAPQFAQATSALNPFYLLKLLIPAYDKAIEHASKTQRSRDAVLNKMYELRKNE